MVVSLPAPGDVFNNQSSGYHAIILTDFDLKSKLILDKDGVNNPALPDEGKKSRPEAQSAPGTAFS